MFKGKEGESERMGVYKYICVCRGRGEVWGRGVCAFLCWVGYGFGFGVNFFLGDVWSGRIEG